MVHLIYAYRHTQSMHIPGDERHDAYSSFLRNMLYAIPFLTPCLPCMGLPPPTRQPPQDSLHKTAFWNMLRVLALAIVGCLGLTVAFSPVCPVYTLHAAKCQAAQTDFHILLGRLGFRSGTLHVCHAVGTTSGGSSSSEEYRGVSKLGSGVAGSACEGGRESNVFSCLMYPSPFPQT